MTRRVCRLFDFVVDEINAIGDNRLMNNTNTTSVYETYSMDYTSRTEWARRADGQWFRRGQYRDPRYGYKWSAWTAVAANVAEMNVADRRPDQRRVRLPKAA